MRIIGGYLKGRRFHPPAANWPTRPTTDFAREALFNILSNQLEFGELRVLDLFGGTGSFGIECISRGCTDVTIVEQYAPCIKFLHQVAKELSIADQLHITKADVFKYLPALTTPFDLIFADPPYQLPQVTTLPQLIFQHNCITPDGLFVLETNTQHEFGTHPHYRQQRQYGGTRFSFFQRKEVV